MQPGALRRISRASSARDRIGELDVHRLRVADEHRHAHAGGGELDLGVEDLLGLDHHLPLFLGVAVLHEHVDVGDHVEGDALGELLGLDVLQRVDRLGLAIELVQPILAGAGHRLIGRDDDALDGRLVVQRLQRDDELRGRAVRIGDDVLACGSPRSRRRSPPARSAARRSRSARPRSYR